MVLKVRGDTMTIAEHILQVLKSQERSKPWLADKIGITRQTIQYKFKSNSFTAEELIQISRVLNINLEELKDKMIKEIENE
jgi:DNA-binding XRE family transcriptional regulator